MKRLLLLLLLLLVSCSGAETVTVVTPDSSIDVTVEIADTFDEQALGLMYRTEMADDHGMLFVFDDLEKRTFWMKNTELVLDIIFIDASGNIVDIKEEFAPCNYDPCELYTSSADSMYVLELNGGFVRSHGIVVGDSVKIE
jgi:uncharacterized protein